MKKNLPGIVAVITVLGTAGCSLTADDESTAESTTEAEAASVVQAQPYCYGSWRGSFPPYSHYTDLRLGGVLASGSNSAMLNECKLRIKASWQWQTTICAGLAGNWTVQTHIGVRKCFDPDNFSTCLPELGSGFSTQCSNGVPVS